MPPPGCEPFLRAICDAPDDDTPRLVYADWLDENGDHDRAEFIRLQIADPERADRPDVPDREFELRDRNRRAWRAELPGVPGVNWGRFRRGFVSGATFAGWRFFHEGATTVFTSAPVEDVQFQQMGLGQLRAFLSDPHADQIRRLDLGQAGFGDEGLSALATGRRLEKLVWLRIDGAVSAMTATSWGYRWLVTDDGAMGLAWTDRLPALRDLILRTNRVSDGVLAALRSKYGPGVRLET